MLKSNALNMWDRSNPNREAARFILSLKAARFILSLNARTMCYYQTKRHWSFALENNKKKDTLWVGDENNKKKDTL